MTRVVSFADGFTSASMPNVATAGQEQYDIANNVSTLTNIAGLDFSSYTSVFIDFEIYREDAADSFRQAGRMTITKDGADWIFNLGNYQGEDLLRLGDEVMTAPEEVFLWITPAGQMQYKTGNMSAVSYLGKLKLQITRIF